MNEIITDKKYPIQRIWPYKATLSYAKFILIIFLFIYLPYYYGDDLTRCMMENRSYKYCSAHYNENRYDNATNGGLIGMKIGFLFFIIPGIFIISVLHKASFRYSVEDKFLTFEQGYFSKEKKYLPYGVIQNIVLRQDLLDRIFGISLLEITNASQGSIDGRKEFGFNGNKSRINGLKIKDAEVLKKIILQKMKENPIDDNQSGL